MLATPHGRTVTKVIKGSPDLVNFMSRMRPDPERWDEPVYMIGIPVEADESLTGTQWVALDENGKVLLNGGEPE